MLKAAFLGSLRLFIKGEIFWNNYYNRLSMAFLLEASML